jgi:outer membrane protein TolC
MKKLVTILFVSISCSLWAQNAFNMKEAVDYALENNLNVKNQKLEYLVAKKQNLEVLSIGFPKINANADYTNFFELPVSLLPGEIFGAPGRFIPVKFGLPHNFKLNFEASQMIFDGRYFVGVKATKDVLKLMDYQITKIEVDTRKSVSNAYIAALVAQESYRLVKSNESTLERLLFETRELYKSGFAEELDVNRLELALANLQTTIKDIENKVKNSKEALKYQMNIPVQQEITLTENLDSLINGATPILDNTGFNPQNRIEYSMLNMQKTLLGYDTKQKHAGYYPGVYAFASYSVNAQRSKFNFFNNEQWFRQGLWGVTMKVSIFDGLTRYASVQQAKIKELEANNTLENFNNGVRLENSVAENNYKSALQALEDQKKNLALAKKINNKTKVMFKEGVGNSFAISQSDADMVTAQINYIQAVYNLLTSKIALDAAQGKLNN